MDVTNLAGTVNYASSSEVSTGILLGLLVLGAVLFLKSDVYPEFAWEFMSKTIRMPFILADIRDHLQELRLTHEMMTEIQDMMTKLQGLLRDIHSAANGLHEEMEKFVTGNVKELKEFEGKLNEVMKNLQSLDGLIRNGNDLGTRSLGEVAKTLVALEEALKILRAEFPQGLLAKKFDYVKDQLKSISHDVNSWYRQDNSADASRMQDASNSRPSDARSTQNDDARPSISLADSIPVPPAQTPAPNSVASANSAPGTAPPPMDFSAMAMAFAQMLQAQAAAHQQQQR